MSFPMVGLGFQASASLQFGTMEPFGSQGTQSADFMAAFRRHHHHHHDCDQDGGPSCGQQNDQLEDIGQNLLQDGQQLVQEGQQLIQQGDFQQGMQLVREGAQLEQQGAQLEAQGGQGTDPYNPMPGGPWNPMGGQDPCNPMNGWGSQSPTGMNGCGDNNYGGGYGDYGGGYSQNCGCGQLSVNGNTVNTGRYTIAASTDNSGTLTVTDNCTGKSFKVWGDPHISTDNGGTADFQHAPATFKLPDGTEITVDPTDNPGVNTINNVTITKGNDAVTMTGFTNGNIQTTHLPGEGYYLDATTQDGTVLTTENSQIDELMLPNGTEIADGKNVGNIDQYANDSSNSQSLGQLQQTIAQIEQEISQIEQGLNMTSFMGAGFANFGAMFA
jgi:hypothetical protein